MLKATAVPSKLGKDPKEVVFPYEVFDENLDNPGSTASVDNFSEQASGDKNLDA